MDFEKQPEPTSQPLHDQTAKLHKHRKPLIFSVIVSVIVAIVLALFLFLYISLLPLDSKGQQRRVTVETGESPAEIANKLEKEGIIRSSFAFQLYARVINVENKLQAGAYALSPSQSSADIIDHMVEGKVDSLRVTVLPGRTLKQLGQDFKAYGFSEEEIDQALNAKYDHPLLSNRPAGSTLEGYIFPETYDLPPEGTLEQLFEKSFDTLASRMEKDGLQAKLTARGFNTYQSFTLASIVQKEGDEPADQKTFAQVFEKRLKEGIALGSDVTFIYGAELLGVEPRVSLDSPYNTRVHKGLPPGPISNFNYSALQAVAEPSNTDFLFFVAGDDGTIYFSKTEEEHNQNVSKYCKKLCELF